MFRPVPALQQEKTTPFVPQNPSVSIHLRLYRNAVEADFVLQHTGEYCKSAAIKPLASSGSGATATSPAPALRDPVNCAVHLRQPYNGKEVPPLLERERERILKCWYYLKLLAYAYRFPTVVSIEDELARRAQALIKNTAEVASAAATDNASSTSTPAGLTTNAVEPEPELLSLLQRMIGEIRRMSLTQLYMLWYITFYLFHFRSEAFARDLGLENPDADDRPHYPPSLAHQPSSVAVAARAFYHPPGTVPPPVPGADAPSGRRPWVDVRERVITEYTYMRRYYQDRNERFLEGPCERCFISRGKGGRCLVRKEGLSLWDV